MDKVQVMLPLTVKNGRENWYPQLQKLIEQIAHPGLEVILHEEEGPLEEIKSAEDASLMGEYGVKAAKKAEQEGIDAVAIGCLLEPGIQEAREKVTIPVVGALRSSFRIANDLGDLICMVHGASKNSKSAKDIEKYIVLPRLS